ncbi:MAG: hypothetical protein ACREP3_12645 [Candidatus Binatia bacterium]
MSNLKLFRISAPFIALGILLLFLPQPGHNAAGTPRFDPRAHIERGDRVEKRYEAYSKRLAKHYAALITAVKEHAPELLAHLQPREPILHGYQILPRITLDPPAEKHAHTNPVAYSWPWTDRLIDDELWKIARSEAELLRAADITSIERRAILERLAQDYGQQSRRLRNIHAHVQYNRLWQAAIASDRSGYDRETALLRAVVERQRIIERINRVHAGFETSRASLDAPLGIAELTGSLRKREGLLSRRIDQAMGQVQTAAFVKLENLDTEWIVHVPLFTDVEDREYVTAVKEIIETTWRLEDGRKSYRVELDVTHISTEALYADKDKPSAGQKIEIQRHLKRFPPGAAILTTGARTTHVQDYAIVLGPHPIAPQVLAHEFGHILGFGDRYVRGYKNLGEHGFQVIEVVADHDDIMAATANGLVQPSHFLRLLNRRVPPDRQLDAGSKLISG